MSTAATQEQGQVDLGMETASEAGRCPVSETLAKQAWVSETRAASFS